MNTIMEIRRRVVALGLCISLGAAVCLRGESPPEREELWVPTKDLQRVLEDYPNAVMLTPEQYQALVRDAGKVKPAADVPGAEVPKQIIIEGLYLSGKVEPGARSVKLTGELVLNVPSDDWLNATLEWPWPQPLLNASTDGPLRAHVLRHPNKPVPNLALVAKGPGRRVLKFESSLPIQVQETNNSLVIPPMPFRGLLQVELPAKVMVLESSAYEKSGDVYRIPFDHRSSASGKADEGGCRIRWTEVKGANLGLNELVISQPRVSYAVDESEVTAELAFHAKARETRQTEVTLGLVGAGVQVVEVLGPQVLKWSQGAYEGRDFLKVTLKDASESQPMTVHLRMPWTEAAGVTVIALPTLLLRSPMKTELVVSLVEGLDLLSSQLGRLDENTKPMYAFGRDQPKIQVQRSKPRLEADVDTLVKLDRDSVNLTRTIALRTDRVVREVKLTLPAAEEFIAVESGAVGFEWKRVERTLELRFTEGLTPVAATKVTLTSRKKLAKAWSGPRIAEMVTLENIDIPEGVKIAGYTAVDFDDAWRVSLKEVRGLEDRDARLTPVKGRMAWFGLREWTLGMEVERAASVYSAEITAYALPRARTVEMEGQILLDITGAPLRSFQLRLPVVVAPLLRVTSPLVGEQQLDSKTGLWTFTLRQESRGRPNIRFRMSQPAVANANEAAGGDKIMRATLPHLEMPQARRFQGTWVVEANTDTQLAFEPKAMQPLDVLRAPAVTGYAPRHRLVSAFTYGAGVNELKLTARRHAHSELAVLVVNRLDMTSVLSADGTSRHEAVIHLRHSGEQFLPIRLPANAHVLSVMVEHAAVKPVRGEDGGLAIPLPAESANRTNVRAVVLYNLPGKNWGGRGSHPLPAVVFPGNIPILSTDWRVHVPEGYSYGEVKTRLESTGQEISHDLWSTLWGIDKTSGLPEQVDERLLVRRETENRYVNEAGTRRVNAALSRIIIPQVSFSGATLGQAVNFLIEFWDKPGLHENDPAMMKVRWSIENQGEPSNAQISLDLKDVPMVEALRYITELAGMKYRIHPDRIVIVPVSETTAEQYTRVYKVPSDLADRVSSPTINLTTSKDPFASRPATNAPAPALRSSQWWMQAFMAQGIPFPDGSAVSYDEKRGELLARSTQPNLDLIEAFLESVCTPAERLVLNPVNDPLPPDGANAQALFKSVDELDFGGEAYLRKKANSIVFPQVNFSGASLEEAVESLRAKSRDLDAGEDDQARKGINVLVKQGEAPNHTKITLDLKDVPMGEALRYIAELAGMQVRFEPFAILLVPVSETNTAQYTRVFKVPPNFMEQGSRTSANSADVPKSRSSTMEILTSKGIPFPDGASAVFNSVTSQLIVRDTQANLDKVEAFIQKLRAEAPPVEPVKMGLLPLDLELPEAGILLRFNGDQAPEALTLKFVSWERQLLQAVVWMLLGAAAFIGWGRRRRPWLRTFLVTLVLTAGVSLATPGWLTGANAVLAGWLLALVSWLLWSLVQKLAAASIWMAKDSRSALNDKEVAV